MSRKNMKHRRDERYRRAVGRQLLRIDAGGLIPHHFGDMDKMRFSPPAPIEQFLRPEDTVGSCDWRSWVVAK